MYTSVTFFALASFLAGQNESAPTWMQDYWQAQAKAQKENQPLAVFLGTGKNGFQKVSRDGILSPAVQKLLAQKYRCVYLDLSKAEDKKLADALAITRGTGLVISDRTGLKQAFHHDGDLSGADLVRILERYADAKVNLRTTEGNTTSRTSFYSGGNPPATFSAPMGRGC